MRPISPSTNCNHQANSAYDKLAVISENMNKLLEVEQFIFELKQWLRAYIDKIKENISEENFANLANDNTFTGINTFTDVHLQDGNIYWVDALGNKLAWVAFDSANQILTLHVQDSELTLSPNIAMTVPTDADIPNSIVTYSFLNGLLQELENTLRVSTTDTITQGSTDLPTSDAVYQFVTNNQFQLTLEDSVIEDSSNGVKSSGIFTALKNLEDSIDTLRGIIEANENSIYNLFGVEDGIYTAITHIGTTFLTGHLYKVVSNIHTAYGNSGPTHGDRQFQLSSDNVEAVKILTYPNISVHTVFRPLEDITIVTTNGGALKANEYVLANVNTEEELTTKQLIGGDYYL